MHCGSCDQPCEGFGNYRIHNGEIYCDSCYYSADERGDLKED